MPAGAIFDTMELTEQADFERRGIMQTMEHPIAGPFKMPGWPVPFGGRTPDVKPSPLLGQLDLCAPFPFLLGVPARGRVARPER